MRDRTREILRAVIIDFIQTATPIASKSIVDTYEINVSSATVRNEFSILEEVGLVMSPHQSAGKTPTAKGYKYFVENMLDETHAQEQARAQEIFSERAQEYRINKSKESVFDILRIIASVSGNVGFATIENDETFYVGVSNILREPEFIRDPEKAAEVMEILEGRDRFLSMLHLLPIEKDEVKIFIGEKDLLNEISSCSMLATSFCTSHTSGILGILGPMRMNYAYNKALLREALQMLV